MKTANKKLEAVCQQLFGPTEERRKQLQCEDFWPPVKPEDFLRNVITFWSVESYQCSGIHTHIHSHDPLRLACLFLQVSKAFDITYVFSLAITMLICMSQSQNLPFTWKIANVKMTKTLWTSSRITDLHFWKAVFRNTLPLLNSTQPTVLFAKESAHVFSLGFIIIYLVFTFQNKLLITIRSI